MQIAGSVELDERLPSAAGTDLPVGHDGMSGQRSAVGRPTGQFALVEYRSDASHDARAPLRVARVVVPAVNGRPRQADATERDIVDREAQMFGGHAPTVTVRVDVALWRGSARAISARAILAP